MKKITLLTILIAACFISRAQVIEKNKKIVGGSFSAGFNHSQADTTISSEPSLKGNNLYINLSPSFGKAIRNNLVYGYDVSLSLYHSKTEDLHLKQVGKSGGYGLGGGIFIEKFFPLSKSFSFSGYLPLQINYNTTKNKVFDNSNLLSTGTTKNYSVGISAYPSLNYSLNKKFLLQLFLSDFISIGYSYQTSEIKGAYIIENKQSNSNFGFNTKINSSKQLSNLGFAFRYIF